MAAGTPPPPPSPVGVAQPWRPAPSWDAVLFQGQFLEQGHQGPVVAELQKLLGVSSDGQFGAQTRAAVEAFQRAVHISPSSEAVGRVGKTTLRTLLTLKRHWLPAPSLEEIRKGSRLLGVGQAGPAVKEVQRLLQLAPAQQDGFFGAGTQAAVVDFQRKAGLPQVPGSEGVIGQALLEALLRRQGQAAGTGAGVTLQQLRAIMPRLSEAQASSYLPHLNAAMAQVEITTPRRQAAFLAQLAHESGELRFWEELADGKAYEGRRDLGNTQPGDGPRYKGRGPIQLTGRANYRAAGQALGIDLEKSPERARDPDVGFRVAAWYWQSRGLNALADAGDFREITRRINGGYNGLPQREEYYARALRIL
ncbi:MAG: peptidoglycan-binding protein [Myxococcaceae bacterium]|nr:peptidoglycan-binding protein [Myxococcaceae bacterium]